MLQVLNKDWTALEMDRGPGLSMERALSYNCVQSCRLRKGVGEVFQPGIRAVLVLATEPTATLLVSEWGWNARILTKRRESTLLSSHFMTVYFIFIMYVACVVCIYVAGWEGECTCTVVFVSKENLGCQHSPSTLFESGSLCCLCSRRFSCPAINSMIRHVSSFTWVLGILIPHNWGAKTLFSEHFPSPSSKYFKLYIQNMRFRFMNFLNPVWRNCRFLPPIQIFDLPKVTCGSQSLGTQFRKPHKRSGDSKLLASAVHCHSTAHVPRWELNQAKPDGKSHEERAARPSLESSTPGKEESMLNSACNCALPLSCQLLFIPGNLYCIFNFCIAPQLYASVVISSKSLKAEWLIQGSRYILRSMITSKKDLCITYFFFSPLWYSIWKEQLLGG